jgi:hypothetical protein
MVACVLYVLIKLDVFYRLLLQCIKLLKFSIYSSLTVFPNVGRTWAVACNPEYDGLILVLSLSLPLPLPLPLSSPTNTHTHTPSSSTLVTKDHLLSKLMSNTIESKGGKSAISPLFALPVSMCFLKWTALMEYGKYKKLVTSITVSCCLWIINYMPCNKAVGEIPFHLKSLPFEVIHCLDGCYDNETGYAVPSSHPIY